MEIFILALWVGSLGIAYSWGYEDATYKHKPLKCTKTGRYIKHDQ